MAEKIAKEDITKVNEAGQTVVLVPAGQPIPDDLDERLAATVPHRTATDEEVEAARQKGAGGVIGSPSEDKARRSSRGK